MGDGGTVKSSEKGIADFLNQQGKKQEESDIYHFSSKRKLKISWLKYQRKQIVRRSVSLN